MSFQELRYPAPVESCVNLFCGDQVHSYGNENHTQRSAEMVLKEEQRALESENPGSSSELVSQKRSWYEASLQENSSHRFPVKKSKTSISELSSGGCSDEGGKMSVNEYQKVFTSGNTSDNLNEELDQNSRNLRSNVLCTVLLDTEQHEFDILPNHLKDNLSHILKFIQQYQAKSCNISMRGLWRALSRYLNLNVNHCITYIHESSITIDGVLVSKSMDLTKKGALSNACRLLIQRIMFLSAQKKNGDYRKPLCSGVAVSSSCTTNSRKSDQCASCDTCNSGCNSTLDITQEVPLSKRTETEQSMQNSDPICGENCTSQVAEFEAIPKCIIDELNRISHFVGKHYNSECSAEVILEQVSARFGVLFSYHFQNIKLCSLKTDDVVISKANGMTEKSAKCMADRLAIKRLVQLAEEGENSDFEFLEKPCLHSCCKELQNQSDHGTVEMNWKICGSSGIPVGKWKTSRSNILPGGCTEIIHDLPKENNIGMKVLPVTTKLDQKGGSGEKRQNSTVLHESKVVSSENSSQKIPKFDLVLAVGGDDDQQDSRRVVVEESGSKSSRVQEAFQLDTGPKNVMDKAHDSLQHIAKKAELPTGKVPSNKNISEHLDNRIKHNCQYNTMSGRDCGPELRDFNMLPENLKNKMGPVLQFIQESLNQGLCSLDIWKKASEIFDFTVDYKSTSFKACCLKVDNVLFNKGVGVTKKDAHCDACISFVEKLIWLSGKEGNAISSDEKLKHSEEFDKLPKKFKQNLMNISQYIQNSHDGHRDVRSLLRRMSKKFEFQVEYQTECVRESFFEIDGILICKANGPNKMASRCVAGNLAIYRLKQLSTEVNCGVKTCVSNRNEMFDDKMFISKVSISSSADVHEGKSRLEGNVSHMISECEILPGNLELKTEVLSSKTIAEKSNDFSVKNEYKFDSFPRSLKDNCLNICQFIKKSVSEQVPIVKIMQDVSTKFGLKVENHSKICLQAEKHHEWYVKIDGVVVGVGKGSTGKAAQDEANKLVIERVIKLSSDIKMYSKYVHKSCRSDFSGTFVKKEFITASCNANLVDNCKNNIQKSTLPASEDNSCQKTSDPGEMKQILSESKAQNSVPDIQDKISTKADKSACGKFDHVALCLKFPVVLDFSDITKIRRSADVLSNTANFNQMKWSYQFETIENDTWHHEVRASLVIGRYVVGSATGESKPIAREAVSREALNILKRTAYTVKIKHDDFVIEIKKLSENNLDKSLTNSNIGYKMMKAMGWTGGGLGAANNKGIEEPIRIDAKYCGQGLGFIKKKRPVQVTANAVKEVITNYSHVKTASILIFLPGFKKRQKIKIERFAKKLHLHCIHIGAYSGQTSIVISRYSSAHELLNSLKEDAGHASKYEIIPPTVMGTQS